MKIIVIIYLVTSCLALIFIYFTLDDKINDLGTRFAIQHVLKEKNKISNPIKREISLSQKMVDTPILKQWAQNESDQQLKERAIAELESYRRNFKDKSYFFIVDDSQNYYFNNKENEYAEDQYRYTLDETNEDDKWYFSTIEEVDDFMLNVNIDRELKTTKLWINAIMYNDEGEKIGMGGSGLTLDRFLNEFLDTNNSYLTPILFDKQGFIQAYEDKDYIKQSAISSDFAQEDEKTIYSLLNEKEKIDNIMESFTDTEDSESVKTMNVDLNGEERIASVSYIPSIDWYAMTLLDTSEIFSFMDFALLIIGLITSLFLIVVGIVYFLNKIVIRPIIKLTDFTDVMAEGDYEARIDLNSDNELGSLANSFNEMAETIHQYTDHLEEQVEERTEELRATNQELEAKNQKIMDSISYAQKIQQSILPESEKINTSVANFFDIWRPTDIVGGDFYWFKKVGSGYYMAVIDCTGHGVPGALMTMTANSILNRIIDNSSNNSPAKKLEKLNRLLKNTLNQISSNNLSREAKKEKLKREDGLDIGLCYVNTNREENQAVFAGAGIPLYYNKSGEIKMIKPDKQGIGYYRSEIDYKYTNHSISLSPDDVLYMASDGYVDQNGGPEDKRLGRQYFIEILNDISGLALEEQKNILETKLDDYMGDKRQRDDITLIGFKVYS